MGQRPKEGLVSRWTRVYIGVVIGAGCALAAYAAAQVDIGGDDLQAFLVLMGLAILGELFPVRVPFRHEAQEITLSTTFVLGALLAFGLPAAVIAQVAGSVLSDAHLRKPIWKAGFNVGQYTLAWTAAAIVLTAFHGGPMGPGEPFALAELGTVLAVGMAFFLVNSTLVAIPIAATTGVSLPAFMRRDLGFQASTALVLTSLSPVVVVLADIQPLLLPLLLFPIVAVHRSAEISLEKDHQAHHDALTGLPNRVAFHEWVEEMIERATDRLCVLIIDLDSFKEVNDTLGHEIGDRLLCRVAERLAEQFDGNSTVARLGGDEFAVGVVASGADCAALGERVVHALSAPVALDGLMLPMGASVGVASYPRDGEDVGTLLQRADVAMYLAKSQRTSVEVYQPERDHHTTRRLTLIGELHQAIEHGNIVFHYQPVADLRSGHVVGVEALVRWDHPIHGLIPPDEFVPLAEPTGLIEALTSCALEQALAQCRKWLDAGHDLNVAVNVSVRNLYEEGFARRVGRHLALARVEPAHLTLEITESTVMMDPARAMTALGELDAMGVQLAIDDFGTGHSSLARLGRLPVHHVKIDRSFVLDMSNDDTAAAIVRSTIDLARNLGLQVVAEGVETEAHWTQLEALGCDYAQGFLVGRPAPADLIDLEPFVPALRSVATSVQS
jgi:diguanylate cyclase (GGDEF)-like protein